MNKSLKTLGTVAIILTLLSIFSIYHYRIEEPIALKNYIEKPFTDGQLNDSEHIYVVRDFSFNKVFNSPYIQIDGKDPIGLYEYFPNDFFMSLKIPTPMTTIPFS